MSIFTVSPVSIVSGAERHGAAVTPPAQVTSASVQLSDSTGATTPAAGSNWLTTTGNITRWGVQASRSDGTFANDGTDWNNQGSIFQDNIAFGSVNRKDGSMPSLFIRSTDANGNPLPIAPAGVKLRLAIQVDTTITLGAVVKTNADAV